MVVAYGGPWTKRGGSSYTKVGADYYTTTRYVLPAEEPGIEGFGTTGFFGQQYSIYSELGIPNEWPIQMAARLPLTVSEVTFEAEDLTRKVKGTATNVRFGDLQLTPQIALSKKAPIALSTTIKLPLYQIDKICSDSIYKDFCARPGDGQIDITPRLLAGGSLAKGKMWVEGSLGWRFRTEVFRNWSTARSFNDSLVFGGLVGGKLGKVLLMARISGNLVVGEDLQKLLNPDFVRNRFTAESITVGPSLMVPIGRGFALEARGSYDLYARNTSQGLGYGAGISWSK